MTRLLLVVPCYNEAGRLEPDAFLQSLESRNDLGFLFVNDGSTDATSSVLADIVARGNGTIDALSLPHNVGKAEAVRRGVLAAFEKGAALVGCWDADLATPLTALPEFIAVPDANPTIDIVMGARVALLGRHIHRHALRHYTGRLFATIASLALHVAVYDTQCGAKVFRVNQRVQQAFIAPFRSKWVFDVEILARYIGATGREAAVARIYELPLHTWIDVPGSKIRPLDGIRALWDIARIWGRSGR